MKNSIHTSVELTTFHVLRSHMWPVATVCLLGYWWSSLQDKCPQSQNLISCVHGVSPRAGSWDIPGETWKICPVNKWHNRENRLVRQRVWVTSGNGDSGPKDPRALGQGVGAMWRRWGPRGCFEDQGTHEVLLSRDLKGALGDRKMGKWDHDTSLEPAWTCFWASLCLSFPHL